MIERVIEALIEDGMREATNVLVTGTRYVIFSNLPLKLCGTIIFYLPLF